ncbi:MAG TPA: aldehyde ferredoxin oxidoreductase C-terminal domain-containing protein [Anaerolineales bacterium]|nr:aldehyde ferredoxin oxidoreductase C-terminal domain-containing protein [Anaerolineales bacterium]
MPNLDPHLKVWRVNLRDRTLSVESTPESWQPLGGRALLARILLDETPPECDPLGEHNKLVFAPGLLVGHMLSSCDRISIGAKSPLTGGIKEANAGGRTGLQLALLGIKALIIEGRPDPQNWMVLHLSADGARFEPAGDLVGKGVYDTAPPLLEKYGDKVAIALIGPGGERGLLSAGIQNADKEGTPSRIAARGGLGALMGSRRLKAIVIDGSGGEKPPIADPKAFSAARKAYNKALMGHPQTKVYADYGTIAVARMCQSFGVLPVRNFSEGTFEGLETISAEHMRATLLARGGDCDTSHACMVGCAIRSSNVYGDPDGKAIVSPLEYETIGLMGPNLGIDDLDMIARLNREVNDLGLDTIEIGCSLGIAADAGLMDWGDGERALELLHEIRQDTPLGRILGHGPALAGKVLGVERVPAVKNQAMSAYDPRSLKGTGVTYATSPQGADHTCGLTIRAPIDHLDPKGQVALSRNSQIKNAGFDALGACMFTGFGFNADLQVIPDLLNARYGWNLTTSVLEDLGRESLRLELEYNRRAGFTRADDRLPEWMSREPLAPTNAVFDVDTDEMDHIWDIFDDANANGKPA